MKIALFLITTLLLSGTCQKSAQSSGTSSDSTALSTIDGNWELVENVVNGKVVKPVRPQQLKIFNDGFFSFIHYNTDGSFHGSGAGTYSLNGSQYKETFRYYNDTTWVGYSDQQSWELRGDTLIFAGFKKVFDRSGKEMPSNTWGGDTFIEKRVRAKP